VSLKEANEHRNEWFEGVHKCKLEETLQTIMERIVRAEVYFDTCCLFGTALTKSHRFNVLSVHLRFVIELIFYTNGMLAVVM
jgi:hypothetical protein